MFHTNGRSKPFGSRVLSIDDKFDVLELENQSLKDADGGFTPEQMGLVEQGGEHERRAPDQISALGEGGDSEVPRGSRVGPNTEERRGREQDSPHLVLSAISRQQT